MDFSLSALSEPEGQIGRTRVVGWGVLARGAQQQAAQREERQGEESGKNDLMHARTISKKRGQSKLRVNCSDPFYG